MNRADYVRIKLSNIAQEFVDEYNLTKHTCNGWVYFAEILANDLLCIRPSKAGYYEAATTPGLWRHKWFSILFGLIVKNFLIEYVVKLHAHHLLQTLQ